jgi:SAM-dependent methyltransferase
MTLRTSLRGFVRGLRSQFVWFGGLRYPTPINPAFGRGKGTPVDRHYIERFLAQHADTVQGAVLEVGDDAYTRRFGAQKVTSSDVLHATGAPEATIVADLASAPQIASDSFDCIILTQTLHYVFDMRAAVAEIHRILKPGGVVLVTVPGISQISRWDMDRWGDRWRLTTLSARELFETSFAAEKVEVGSYGNALTAVCLLEGVVAERLRAKELDFNDPDYQMVVTVAATK